MAISDRSPVSATDPTVYPLRASRLSCPTRRPTPENWRYATYFDTVPDLTRYSSYDSLSSTEDTLNMDLDRTSVSATSRDIGIHVEKESPHGYHAGAGQTFDDKHTHSKAPEMSELEKAVGAPPFFDIFALREILGAGSISDHEIS